VRQQVKFLMLSCFFVVLFFLARTYSWLMQALNDFVCIFAYATSYDIKVSFFLIYAAFCCFLLFVSCDRKVSLDIKKVEKASFVLVFLLAFFGIFSHFAFLLYRELPFSFQGKYWFWLDGVGDTTSLHHLHTLKPTWYYAISFFKAQHFFGRLDPATMLKPLSFVGAGYPATEILPPWFFYLSFFICFSLFVLLSIILVQKAQEWKKEKIVFLPLYVISSFSLLSYLVDGGMFTHQFVFAFNCFVFLLRYRAQRPLKSYKPEFLFCTFSILLLLLFHTYANIFLFYFPFYIALLVLYAGSIALFFVFRSKPGVALVIIGLFYVVFSQGMVLAQGYVFNRDPLYQQVSFLKGDIVWITTYFQKLPLKVVYDHDPVVIYEDIIEHDMKLVDYAHKRGLDKKWVFNQIKVACFSDQECSKPLQPDFRCFLGSVKVLGGDRKKAGVYKNEFFEVRLTGHPKQENHYDLVFCVDSKVSPLNFYTTYVILKDILETEKFTICSLQAK